MQMCLRDGRPIPKAIQNAPELWMGLELFFTAWLELTPDRPSGWDVRPIPWTSISQYAEVFGITGEQRDDLFYFVRAMDDAYLKHCRKKSKKK